MSLGSKPSFFSAASEMYKPIVPHARILRPIVRRVRGERLRKDLAVSVSLVSCRVDWHYDLEEIQTEGGIGD